MSEQSDFQAGAPDDLEILEFLRRNKEKVMSTETEQTAEESASTEKKEKKPLTMAQKFTRLGKLKEKIAALQKEHDDLAEEVKAAL